MFCKALVGSASALALVAGSANAAVFFTFADPSTQLEVRGETPSGGGVGDLTYGEPPLTEPVLQFKVDATEEGGSITTFDAILDWDLQYGPATVIGSTVIAEVTGTFEYRRADNDEVILSGDVGQASLIVTIGVGSILTDFITNLTYEVGPALTAADPVVTDLQGEFDGVYTLTRLRFDDGQQTIIGDDQLTYFNSFSANAAFTGTAERIPAPGSVALGALGLGLAATRLRRR